MFSTAGLYFTADVFKHCKLASETTYYNFYYNNYNYSNNNY